MQEATKYLIHNAIKFNKIGGSVEISAALAGGDICLQVADSGVGIPEERLDELWQGLAITEGSNGKKRPAMGLALTRFIVAAHGGQLTAESSYGAGSTFTIHLPAVFAD
ncbi:MAG: sensor histidine kinase [Chloroflexi bacterium]|nr:sensor histidine kinase [Chloroflexota bacterium]